VVTTNTDIAISMSLLGFGADARDRRGDSRGPGPEVALAALETFYYALNMATRRCSLMSSPIMSLHS
jgi:hypothetical protein